MNNWLDYFNIFLTGGAVLLSILGMWFSNIVPGIDRWSKRFFLGYFIILLMCCLFGIIEKIIIEHASLRPAMPYMMVLECLVFSLPFAMQTIILLHFSKESLRSNRLFYSVLGLWIVYCILLVCTLFIEGFCYFLPDGQYYRGPLYPLLLVPLIVIMVLNLSGAVLRRKRFSPKVFRSMLTSILPMLAALIVQMLVEFFPIVSISIVISALSMYRYILSDQIEKDMSHQQEIARQQQEIANQRASIMVLQMRPHFIYNTMTSIYCLCNQDPQMARNVVLDFTTYLRKNFTAITSSKPIPFSSELEHTKAYLAVEQAQYEDSLYIDYDTPHTRFRVPPLTLQPIVENAVKHGRDLYAGPLHISILTRKTEQGSEIVVSDNGSGYNPVNDSEPHTALKNIQQRLELMCKGSLTITPGDEGGTVVTVTIPD